MKKSVQLLLSLVVGVLLLFAFIVSLVTGEWIELPGSVIYH